MTDDNWLKFVEFCAKERDVNLLGQFLDVFLTHEERQSIATRLCIVKALLAEELTQREIAQQFNVSIAKITRGSNELKRLTAEQRQALKILLKK
jgi:TrpR family trp operon transcriptional repressor